MAVSEVLPHGVQGFYLTQTMDMLNSLVPSDAIAWSSIDSGARSVELFGFPNDVPDADVCRNLSNLFEDHPLIASYMQHELPCLERLPAPRRLSDVVADRDLRRTRTFALLLRPVRRFRQLSVVVSYHNGLTRSWTLNRARTDFTDKEVDLVTQLQPGLELLERAYGSTASGVVRMNQAVALLTDKERAVMQHAARGLTAVAIGHLLGCSARTVTTHFEHVYAKLGCNNRIAALDLLTGGLPDSSEDSLRLR